MAILSIAVFFACDGTRSAHRSVMAIVLCPINSCTVRRLRRRPSPGDSRTCAADRASAREPSRPPFAHPRTNPAGAIVRTHQDRVSDVSAVLIRQARDEERLLPGSDCGANAEPERD